MRSKAKLLLNQDLTGDSHSKFIVDSEGEDHYNGDLDMDSTDSTQTSVADVIKKPEQKCKCTDIIRNYPAIPSVIFLVCANVFAIVMVKLEYSIGLKISSMSWE